jgi:mRNA interferase MazF
VAPITGWNPAFVGSYWHVNLVPDGVNGLTKESAVDALQLRGVDVQRFIQFMGRLPASKMEEIAAAIAAVIEYG